MPNTLQDFLALVTPKAADQLAEALLALPAEQWTRSVAGTARTPIDQVAECILNNGFAAQMIAARGWVDDFFTDYQAQKSEIARLAWPEQRDLLKRNTDQAVAAILATPDEALSIPFEAPYGPSTVGEAMAYPYWNMMYHTGQINYVAAILGLG